MPSTLHCSVGGITSTTKAGKSTVFAVPTLFACHVSYSVPCLHLDKYFSENAFYIWAHVYYQFDTNGCIFQEHLFTLLLQQLHVKSHKAIVLAATGEHELLGNKRLLSRQRHLISPPIMVFMISLIHVLIHPRRIYLYSCTKLQSLMSALLILDNKSP